MKKKRIGVITTGGDCSGLNTVIQRIAMGCEHRGWDAIGILDGTDGIYSMPADCIDLNNNTIPLENARLSGSLLRSGRPNVMNFVKASSTNQLPEFTARLKKSLGDLKLDALIQIGGNGSLSLTWGFREMYSDLSVVCIPKTIDMDVPLTDYTIGFNTAVQQLTSFCDQLLLTARSHHRWFVVQAMGRDCGKLALNAGIATGATAIIIPEIKFDADKLVEHIQNAPTDYGIIVVSEGVSLRGHSGNPADIISRKLTAAGIDNRPEYPQHIQRAGDTTATDRIIGTMMADCALNAIDNNETYVMTAFQNGVCKTITLAEFFNSGKTMPDPKIAGIENANASVSPDDPLLQTAVDMGIYIGETK